MSCHNYRLRESLLKERNFNVDGMLEIEDAARRAFEKQMETRRIEAELEQRMFAPIGRLLSADEEAHRASESLREQAIARINQQVAQFQAPTPPRRGPQFEITGGGCSMTPWDFDWAVKGGNCLSTADKNTGAVNTSLGMNSGNQQWAKAGVCVVVIPNYPDDILKITAALNVGYLWVVKTSWGPTAHSNGQLWTLIFGYDATGSLTTLVDQADGLWSAGSSGISDEQSGAESFWRFPSFTVNGFNQYEVWYGVYNQGDASPQAGWGWAYESSHLWMWVDRVCVKDCECH